MAIDIKGDGLMKITYDAVDFTPSGWYKIMPKFNVSKVLKKYSSFGTKNKLNVKVIEDYNIFEIVVDNHSKAEWDTYFSKWLGNEVRLYPHVDRLDLYYDCIVVKADTNWKDNSFYFDTASFYLKQSTYYEE